LAAEGRVIAPRKFLKKGLRRKVKVYKQFLTIIPDFSKLIKPLICVSSVKSISDASPYKSEHVFSPSTEL